MTESTTEELKGKPTPCALTADQEKAWSQTKVKLLWECPAFSHIFYTMLTAPGKHEAIFTKDIPVAATDGSRLLINPDTFFKYTLNERTFVLAHEICHCIFNHLVMIHRCHQTGKVKYSDGTVLPYVHKLMNVAMDLVINDMLINCKDNQGKATFQFNKDWLHDVTIATENDNVFDAYAKVFKKAVKNAKKLKPGEQPGPGDIGIPCSGSGFDQHLAPGTSEGKDPNQATQDRNDNEWTTQVAAAAHAAKVQGKLPAGLERMLSDVLDPQVDWTDALPAWFARKIGSGSRSWARPDRRLIVRDIYCPGRTGFGCGTIVVGVDTSGSVWTMTEKFLAEVAGILEDLRPKQLVIMWCDAKVDKVDYMEDVEEVYALRGQPSPGGGGTDFRPVFDKIDELFLEPDGVIYLTDGYGSFPEPQSYPILWGSITPEGGVTYPHGDVIYIPQK